MRPAAACSDGWKARSGWFQTERTQGPQVVVHSFSLRLPELRQGLRHSTERDNLNPHEGVFMAMISNPLDPVSHALSNPVGLLTDPIGTLTGGGQKPAPQSGDIE